LQEHKVPKVVVVDVIINAGLRTLVNVHTSVTELTSFL